MPNYQLKRGKKDDQHGSISSYQIFKRGRRAVQRQIAKKLKISRNTVSKYLRQNEAPSTINRQKVYGGIKEYSDETKRILPVIDQWLEDDLKRWGKQKHTAARIYRRLVDEYNFKGSESNIRKVYSSAC